MDFKLDLLAQIVGSNFGITVQTGNGFAIDKDRSGKLVVYVPPMSIGNEDDAMIVRSGLCHEAVGHGRHTDFNAERGPSPLHLAMENILEDARIEKAAWKIYPKTRRILEEGMAVMHKRDMLKRASNQSSPAEIASIAVLVRLMVEELGYCKKLIDWKVDWAQAVQCFGDETMNKVWAKAVAGYQTSSTADVIKVAAEIVKLLQNGFADQQQKPKNGKGKSEKGNAKSDDKSTGGSEDEADDSAGGNQDDQGDSSKGDGSRGDPGDEAGDGAPGGASGSAGDDGSDGSGDSDSTGDKDESGDSQNQSGAGRGSSHAVGRSLDLKKVNPDAFDRGDLLKSQLASKTQSAHYHGKILVRDATSGEFTPPAQGKAAAQRLKSALAQRLLAVVEDEDDSLVEYGVLASHRLVDARMGDRDVFVEPGKPGERLDTAFSLLIDSSGSMRGEPADACMAATWAIGSTLNGYAGMGIALTISSFDSALYQLKNWDQPWKRGGCLFKYCPGGSTATYQAVENRLAHLVKRREPRKVLFLITDGDIGDLSSLVNTAREAKVEIVVMMIGDVKHKPSAPYLKRFSVIPPSSIATAMMKTVIELF